MPCNKWIRGGFGKFDDNFIEGMNAKNNWIEMWKLMEVIILYTQIIHFYFFISWERERKEKDYCAKNVNKKRRMSGN